MVAVAKKSGYENSSVVTTITKIISDVKGKTQTSFVSLFCIPFCVCETLNHDLLLKNLSEFF